MKTKSLVLLVMALGCGFVAMLGVQQIMSGERAPKKDVVPVLVARQEIDPGVPIDPAAVSFEDRPRETVPPGAITEAAQFEGRGLKGKAYPGEIILDAKLGKKGEYGIAISIPPGMRVVTVPVNLTAVHSGMIRPGDRVDVLVTYSKRVPGQTETSRTKTVLEYIQVFAVDRIREADADDAGKGAKAENLSVLVTPEQAHVLMLAANKGKLQMALRNGMDKDEANVSAIDDKIFEDFKAETGKETTDETTQPVANKKPETKNFKEFLQTDSAPDAAPEAPAEEEWAIEIFEGETRRVETIKVPRRSGGTTTNGPGAAPANKSSTEVPPVEAA